MKKLLSLLLLLFLVACDKKEAAPVETVASLQNVLPGRGGQCMALNVKKVKCAPSLAELRSGTNIEHIDADSLFLENSAADGQKYRLFSEADRPMTRAQMIQEVRQFYRDSDYNAIETALFAYMKDKSYQVVDWLFTGLNASGQVSDYSLNLQPLAGKIPIKYSIDCNGGDYTSFHFLFDTYGIRLIHEKIDENTYFVESREVSEDQTHVVFDSGFCQVEEFAPNTIEEAMALAEGANPSPSAAETDGDEQSESEVDAADDSDGESEAWWKFW